MSDPSKRYAGVDLSPGSSGVVIINSDGSPERYRHFQQNNTKTDLRARFTMGSEVFEYLADSQNHPWFVALEDYDLSGTQQVGYQIAEATGLFKYQWLIATGRPLALIHPRKLKSYVKMTKDVSKNMVIEWGLAHGFSPPVKTRSNPGYKKRQREDLADAFVLAHIARDLDAFLSEEVPPQKGHILLDPDYGPAFRPDLLFNCPSLVAGESNG